MEGRCFPAAPTADVEAVAVALGEVLAASGTVEWAFGHGSFFEGRPHHDVDVAVRFAAGRTPRLAEWDAVACRLEAVARRPVDLHAVSREDLLFAAAATAGRLLWAADREAAWQEAELTARMAWDARWLRDSVLHDLPQPEPGGGVPRGRAPSPGGRRT